MRSFRMMFAVALLLAPAASHAGDDVQSVRMPMLTHNAIEAQSVSHLLRARDLIRAAAAELRKGSRLHKWPDRDWEGMARNLEGYDKTLEMFLFPSYRIDPYEEREADSHITPVVASEDPYPNGEDLPAGKQ